MLRIYNLTENFIGVRTLANDLGVCEQIVKFDLAVVKVTIKQFDVFHIKLANQKTEKY